jgi:hypothetical protein
VFSVMATTPPITKDVRSIRTCKRRSTPLSESNSILLPPLPSKGLLGGGGPISKWLEFHEVRHSQRIRTKQAKTRCDYIKFSYWGLSFYFK